MTKPDRVKRPRRLASDEAHAWARNLKLGNTHAKLILSMVTLYVDGDGICFVSIQSLADDCEMSADTVRRRLGWLEEIGAISRTPQWLDENGNRNSTGRGKRTTDLIRLLYERDTALIEARAAGEVDEEIADKSEAISPSQQQGLNRPSVAVSAGWQQGLNRPLNIVSPRLGLGQPSHCGEGLISEPEPESPLKSPPGTREDVENSSEDEPEHFAQAWASWRGHEVMRRDLALAEFRALTPDKQQLCRAAIASYNAMLDKHHRKTAMNFHLWIRQKGFEEFPQAKIGEEPAAKPARRWICGAELDGLLVATRMASQPLPRVFDDSERGRGLWGFGPFNPDLTAMACFADNEAQDGWVRVDAGTAQFAAWRDRLQLWLGRDIGRPRIWLEPYDPAVHSLPGSHPNFQVRKSAHALRVPAPWPPHRDGTWNSEESET